LLCTIARRRFLDRMRALRPQEEISEAVPDEARDDGLFTREALAELEPPEREVIVMMDLEGRTRVEVAQAIGGTEGEILSRRRAGLRRLWRWLGRSLPEDEREVWDLLFVGARRETPERLAEKLGLEESDVVARIERARRRLGVDR
jgi:DNA-directed RNA polymerase specialized sigma24 family protein